MREASDPRPGDVVEHDACQRQFTVLHRGTMLDSGIQVVVVQHANKSISVVDLTTWQTPVAGRPRFKTKVVAGDVPG